MIEIKFIKTEKEIGIEVKGHAGQAPKGQDIVCAAVSILVNTFAEYSLFLEATKGTLKKPLVELLEGDSRIYITPKTKYYAVAMQSLFTIYIGLSLLQKTYPEYLKLLNTI